MVPRYSITLAVCLMSLFAGAALCAENAAGQSTGKPTATTLFELRCLSCHGMSLTLSLSRSILDTGGPPALDAHLITHHAPDDEARAAIMDYLLQNTPQSHQPGTIPGNDHE